MERTRYIPATAMATAACLFPLSLPRPIMMLAFMREDVLGFMKLVYRRMPLAATERLKGSKSVYLATMAVRRCRTDRSLRRERSRR